MNRNFSLYLDLFRVCGALLVFFFHAKEPAFYGTFLDFVGWWARDAVTGFIVLSGFVIAMVADTKEHTVDAYLISRFARLYSVVIPALLLTVGADAIGQAIDPSVYESRHFQNSEPWIRFTTTLFLVNEAGLWSWHPFSNGPFWSISYEYLFYLILAAFFYLRGYQRLIWGTASILIAGKTLLLLPVWLLGVALYYFSKRIKVGNLIAGLLFIGPAIVYLLFRDDIASKVTQLLYDNLDKAYIGGLYYSARFPVDCAIGTLFTIHLAGAIYLTRNIVFVIPLGITRTIRYLAGMTFSLYLYHFPLIFLGTALFKNGILTVLMVLLVVAMLAPITEGRKDDLRRLLQSAYAGLSKRFTGLSKRSA